ncbi:MAG: TonB-dependent receptor [Rubrivivax sp.]|nr:TonB-dependent receptor [Rubrivivax sp.]
MTAARTPRHLVLRTPRLAGLAQALAAAGLLGAGVASAQQAASKEDDPQRVVITANKRLEPQREVAGTVSVLDGGDLERRGSRDQESSLKLAPGVQFNKGDVASNTITIRGIGTSTTNEGSGAQQGPTGQYLEDVPLASAQGKGVVYDPLTWDLDRVEVLRGPQGVLFGSGSLGGAVRYLFNKPDLSTFGASIKGEYAKASQGEGTFSLYGMLNAPLQKGTAGLRVVVYDRKDPGYIDNLGTGHKDANDLGQRGGRVLVTVKPSKGLTATLVASTQKTEQGDTFSVSPDATRLEHRAPNDSRRSSTTDFSSLTIDADLGGHTLTSITGHWRNKGTALIDDTELFASVGLALPQVYRPQTSNSRATSQELRIASNPGGSFSYVAGVFYQTSKGSSNGQQIDPSGAFGITTLVDLTSTGGGTEKAVFADTEFRLGGGWSAGAGGRYYRTSTDSATTGTQFGAPTPVGPLYSNDSGFTPKLTLKYRFGDSQWYAVAAKGYRYGGRNAPPTNDEYKSDSLWSYETGVRLSPGNGVQLDLSAFMLDWKDAQFTFFERLNGNLPNSRIGNVGKARSTGLEAALRWRVNAAFDVAASLASIDAKTRAPVTIPSGGPTSITVAPGAKLPGTPDLQAALQANWRFVGPMGSAGRANATVTHIGDRVMFLGGNKPADAFDTLDLGVQFAKGSWTLAAGLANATNEKGVLSITGAPAGVGAFAQYFLQRPRTLTVSLRYDH